MKRIVCAFFIILSAGVLYAEEAKPQAVGVTFDFLPVIMSASAGKPGFSMQIWTGTGHIRTRLIGAQIHMNNALVANSAFENQKLTVGALVVDYVFGKHFDGFWIGSGYEIWQNEITHKKSGTRSLWINQVATVGGGYIFPVFGNFSLEPWCAVHAVMNNRTVRTGDDSFTPRRFSGEVSLKAGYFFDL